MAQDGRVLAVVAALTAVLVAAGCESSGGQAPEPTAEPTVAPRTADELGKSLPTDDQLPDGATDIERCPGSDRCFEPDGAEAVGVLFSPAAPEGMDPADVEERAADSPFPDNGEVRALLFTDETALQEYVAIQRSRVEERDGTFDVAAQDREDGFVPGEDGTGALEEVSIAGWDGWEHTAVATYNDPDGEPMDERQHAEVVLRAGSMVVVARLNVHDDHPESTAADVVRALVDQYLDRLDAS